ncbi:hypothetical protein TNCT_553021 [Trichonephila clavata]|uniref:Uncharacterized protein n=1 Tax=Trichonephila clavata TaxID=2740835 RepID=A0A8X6LGW4_TRICU|nr:hypothetical protein TNCT_553021 [Trichonephila clavata]
MRTNHFSAEAENSPISDSETVNLCIPLELCEGFPEAYHQPATRVPPMVRVPQVGKRCPGASFSIVLIIQTTGFFNEIVKAHCHLAL